MSGGVKKDAFAELGLRRGRTGHLVWVMWGGRLRWTPVWVRSAIMAAWNYAVCRIRGHDVIGPWPDTRYAHKRTCMHCGREWPVDSQA